jgi:hypothetical protein
MAMCNNFQNGELPLFHLNFGTIVLLPKKEKAIETQQISSNYVLVVSFKVFTKVGTKRITKNIC